MAPAGQLGVVVRVLGRDDLQTGVAHQVPVLTTHVFWSRENREEGGVGTVEKLPVISVF